MKKFSNKINESYVENEFYKKYDMPNWELDAKNIMNMIINNLRNRYNISENDINIDKVKFSIYDIEYTFVYDSVNMDLKLYNEGNELITDIKDIEMDIKLFIS